MKLLKFYADWCQPCKQLTPILKELIKDKDIQLEEIDASTEKELVKKYGVRSIPVLFFVDNEGNSIGEFKGFDSSPAYKTRLKEFLEAPTK